MRKGGFSTPLPFGGAAVVTGGTSQGRIIPPKRLFSPLTCPVIPPAPVPQICCSFGVDVLEALAASCTQVAGAGWSRRGAFNLACDATVASALLVLHGATMMSQVGWAGVAEWRAGWLGGRMGRQAGQALLSKHDLRFGVPQMLLAGQ